jgi:chromosome segregation ATPase
VRSLPHLISSEFLADPRYTGTEKEVRLTALINCVGLRSLDELEDFVYLHGSGKLVPVEQADAADEETQLVASPGKKAMRYHQRKEELKMSRDEVKRTVVELNYSKETHREDLRKLEDVERRLGVMSREKQELERRLDELSVEGGLQEQLGSCYSIIDGLDDQLRRIGEYVDQVELERDSYIEAAKESEAARVILQEQMDELLHRAMSVPQYVLALSPSWISLMIDISDLQDSSQSQRRRRSRTNPPFDHLTDPVQSLSTPHLLNTPSNRHQYPQ